jgi:transposase InsO family protein
LRHVTQGLLLGQRCGGDLFLDPETGAEYYGDRQVLISPQQPQRDLAFWIEVYYNRERRHSSIGYMSPID